MFSTTFVIVIGAICYITGAASMLMLDRRGVSLEKRVALLILAGWFAFAMIAYLQQRELSIFFNAAGMGAVGNLLGIKTAELVKAFIPYKK